MMKFVALAALAVCVLLPAVPSHAALYTVALTDSFGADSGWDAILADNIHTGIVVDKVTSTYVRVEIFKELYQPAEGGIYPPNVITFHQRAGVAPGVSTIRITDETILNHTGSTWLDYHWSVTENASFNRTLTDQSGFSIAPFTVAAWGAASYDADHSQTLGVSGGSVADGATYRPGMDAGELYINIAPNAASYDFTLTQVPTPEPATLAVLAAGAAAALLRRRRR